MWGIFWFYYSPYDLHRFLFLKIPVSEKFASTAWYANESAVQKYNKVLRG